MNMRSSFLKVSQKVAQTLVKSTLLLVTLWFATAAATHETRSAVADVFFEDGNAKLEIYLNAESLLAGIDQSQYSNTNDAPEAADYDALRLLSDADLIAKINEDWATLSQGIDFAGAGTLTLDKVEVDSEPNFELPRDTRLFISAPVQDGVNEATLSWVKEYGGLVLRWGTVEDAFAVLLRDGEVSPVMKVGGGTDETALSNFWRFIVEGFEHIIPKGLDHILFVLGLFFFSLHVRPLLWQVTAFTIAHTVTLGMATLGVINIPDEWMWLVEALIALSISYVAIENILRPQLGWWRIAVVFGFGLLHGLGFASVLSDLGLTAGRFLASLIAFNIGVEIGQLAVIAVAFLAIVFGAWLARKGQLPAEEVHAEVVYVMHRSVSIIGSLIIGVIGLYWVIERTVL